jgi:putative PIN family toxin of toxin-antitoxin system
MVLDTNVLLAGLATHGLCEQLVAIVFRDHDVVLSEYILDEVTKHYVGKLKGTVEQAAHVAEVLRVQAEIVEPAAAPTEACDDPDDLPVLGTAVAGKADCLVTGDQGLLRLTDYEGIPILSPRVFYDRLRDSG